MAQKVVLAYSGGLDTSYCLTYLTKIKKYEVHTVLVNTGGFCTEELKEISARAIELGSARHFNIDILDKFYNKCIKYMIYGNILKNNTYPLSVSAERVFQAIEIIEYAQKVGAKYIAHGCTGAGNDQVRFDGIFQTLVPDIEIIAPIRDKKLSREEELSFLQDHGVSYTFEKAKYSINVGIWGTSIGGVETLTSSDPLPEDSYPNQLNKKESQKIILSFEKGELVALNGEKGNSVSIIQKLNKLAGEYAIGRDIHVGDTIIGIKGRVGFEAPGPILIIKSHHLLEKHVMTKWQLYWKEQVANFYGMLLHEGNYYDAVMRDIEAFLESSQASVSGDVYVTLYPYRFTLDGINSKYDLMNSDFGQYGEMNNLWNPEEAKGFIRLYSVPNKIYHKVNSHKK